MTQARPAKSPRSKSAAPKSAEAAKAKKQTQQAPKKALKKALKKVTQAVAAPAAAPSSGRRVQVKRSGVHGKGVFAARPIAKGEVVIEYTGEIITWEEALDRHPHDPADPNHTFYFHLDDGHVIDGKHNGNAAKWINHSCKPNCEADQEGDRVFIKALRAIPAGEELFYNYGLVIDEPMTPKLKREFACHCGAKRCTGTMLAGRK